MSPICELHYGLRVIKSDNSWGTNTGIKSELAIGKQNLSEEDFFESVCSLIKTRVLIAG